MNDKDKDIVQEKINAIHGEIEKLRKSGDILVDENRNITLTEKGKLEKEKIKKILVGHALNEGNVKGDLPTKEEIFRNSVELGQLWRKEGDKPVFAPKTFEVRKDGKPIDMKLSEEELKNFTFERDTSEELMFKSMNIPDNDRLKYYQLLKKFLNDRMQSMDVEDFVEQARIAYLKTLWNISYKASMDNAEVFDVDEDVVPLLLNNNCESGHLPFPSIFINSRIQIKNRTYLGIFVGSYYTETEHYRGVFSCHSRVEIMKRDNKPVRTLNIDFFSLDPVKDIPTKDDYYTRKLKKYIFAFCNFINEPDVYSVPIPLNPKNNVRRTSRGLAPLPSFKTVSIRGKLREYVDRVKQANASGTRRPFSYKFKVRGFYRHYRNLKRYAKLYTLTDDILKNKGYEKEKGLIKRWVNDSVRGQGILIKQTWEVKQ